MKLYKKRFESHFAPQQPSYSYLQQRKYKKRFRLCLEISTDMTHYIYEQHYDFKDEGEIELSYGRVPFCNK